MPVTPPDSELSMSSSSGGGECAIAIETRVRDGMMTQNKSRRQFTHAQSSHGPAGACDHHGE